MNKRIGIFSPYALNTPHFETELEIAQLHLDQGDEVFLYYCRSIMQTCDINRNHNKDTCEACFGRFKNGCRLLHNSKKLKKKSYLHIKDENRISLEQLKTDFDDLDDLKNLYIKNYDIGYGVLSSLISYLRTPQPNIKENALLIKRFITSSAEIYFSIINIIERDKLDHMYLYNGRYSPFRAAMRACQACDLSFSTIEVARNNHHYHLFHNTIPHDPEYRLNEMNEAWDKEEKYLRKKKIADSFFLNRSKGGKQWRKTFTEGMGNGKLPTNWNTKKRNIGIFISSEDEFAAIGASFNNPLYKNQLDGIKRIISDLKKLADHDLHLYVKIHPRLKTVDSSLIEPYLKLANSFVTIIKPEENIDTYELVKKSDKVLTFGSTVGIEAVYWGTPSILIGKSFYEKEANYIPLSHNNVLELLLAYLEAKDNIYALKYGYYISTFGRPFKYYKSESLFKGKFKGKEIIPSLDIRARWKLRSLILRLKIKVKKILVG